MDDKQLDKLIRENFEREAMIENINRQVMRQINHRERHITLRRFLRMVLVAFGTPIILIGYGFTIYHCVMEQQPSAVVFAVLAISILIAVASFAKIIQKFSTQNL